MCLFVLKRWASFFFFFLERDKEKREIKQNETTLPNWRQNIFYKAPSHNVANLKLCYFSRKRKKNQKKQPLKVSGGSIISLSVFHHYCENDGGVHSRCHLQRRSPAAVGRKKTQLHLDSLIKCGENESMHNTFNI